MNTQHQLAAQLRILKLGGFLESLDVRLQQAKRGRDAASRFFATTGSGRNRKARGEKAREQDQSACFEEEKTLEALIFHSTPRSENPTSRIFPPVFLWKRKNMC